MRPLRLLLATAVLAAAAGLVVGPVPAAHAQGRVTITNADGAPAIDPTYATELRVSGSGFQVVRGGRGGVYVFFGTVSGSWRPSQGGSSGVDYRYLPDSEARDNRGYQRYVAFPGSDTAGSAQSVMSGDGSWSATITVPGARFQAIGRNGAVETVDCRQVTCGIITIGAHGVVNANNESFTPVRVEELADPPADDGTATELPDGTVEAPETADPGVELPARLGPVRFTVDRASATAGRVLPFAVQGLRPRSQVSAVLDDGLAAAGPFLVGDDGRMTGVITLPEDLPPGTHELRLFGLDLPKRTPVVRFAVAPADDVATPTAAPAPAAGVSADDESGTADAAGVGFFVAAGVVLLAALLRLLLLARGRRARG
ncbi:hypothetical protein [Nocardioides sp. TF02-7]|uniref:hypothetical protein n=1 Tax=Nocardioides sp. TF02-7 TaxID=2917724 RepID=UPI001F05C6A2|nr:hypothetical protein [Nocardioides sp. TF02-7]UMG93273.1 hypothetical protein MF408_03025 [Nocardioides sp. TF02-7]